MSHSTSVSTSDSWPVGLQVGRYRITAPPSSKRTLETYTATLQSTVGVDRVVSLMRLAGNVPSTVQSSFVARARLAARLCHPNVAQVTNLEEHEGICFAVMEHVEGDRLDALVERLLESNGSLPLEHAVKVLCDLCCGLEHEAEVLRACGAPPRAWVSASDVMLSVDGSVKLISFDGSARNDGVRDRRKPRWSPAGFRRLRPFAGETLVRALGELLLELTTGLQNHPLHPLRTALSGSLSPRVWEELAALPEVLADIACRACILDADDLFETVADFHQELEDFALSHDLTLSPPRLSAFLSAYSTR